ncbi:hypothetical protein [Patiriisocius hiemis]|uniref:Uncharacterized protein n=1 Tax=Patiriisocius hiemis TaxID=3075604 RepID=A0ABU2YDT0_9FLAO|nr:hypothetical protein [Constantimarinum sp. W242]MDT0555208.1 hypothetical protein [Constantimarinum sp. W242]
MKKFLLLFLIIALANNSYSQLDVSGGGAAEAIWTQNYNKQLIGDVEISAIEGSPYVTEAFLPGKIYSGGKVQNQNVLLRYNIYNDLIEVEDPSKGTKGPHNSVLRSSRIWVEIAGKKYVYMDNFRDDNHTDGSYLVLLKKDENFNLYKKHNAKLNEARKARNSYERDKPASFTQNVSYYFLDNSNNEFIEVPDRKSKAIKKMESLKKGSKSFIAKNKLDLEDENDMITLFNFVK